MTNPRYWDEQIFIFMIFSQISVVFQFFNDLDFAIVLTNFDMILMNFQLFLKNFLYNVKWILMLIVL